MKKQQKNKAVSYTHLDVYKRQAYVSFFVDNPAYFQFLYSQSNIKIDLSLSIPDDQNYKPYIIYKNIVSKLLEQSHYPEEKQNDIIITIWAFIPVSYTHLDVYKRQPIYSDEEISGTLAGGKGLFQHAEGEGHGAWAKKGIKLWKTKR